LRSFTKILQRKNIRYGPIKHDNACVPTLSFNNFLSLNSEILSYGISSSRSTKKMGINLYLSPLPYNFLICPNQLDIFANYLFFGSKNIHSNYLGGSLVAKNFLMKKFSTMLEDNQDKRQYNPLFCSYLTGLVEGDGTIVVPKQARSPKGKLNYPSIQIVFDERDLPLAVIIQKELGFGSISKTKGVNAYRFSINNFEGIITMVKLMNGYFRTPKIIMFNCLIDFLNQKDPNLLLSKKDIDNSLLDSNAWLSGFLDADGYFAVIINSKGIANCRFELVQSSVNHLNLSKRDLMVSLSELLKVNILESTRKNYPGYMEYIVRTGRAESNKILINYLDQYSLFSSKYLNYQDYKKVSDMIIKKEHKTIKEIEAIRLIKNGMNSKRTEFNWDHMLNFYKLYKKI
jgi:hypothetical protein